MPVRLRMLPPVTRPFLLAAGRRSFCACSRLLLRMRIASPFSGICLLPRMRRLCQGYQSDIHHHAIPQGIEQRPVLLIHGGSRPLWHRELGIDRRGNMGGGCRNGQRDRLRRMPRCKSRTAFLERIVRFLLRNLALRRSPCGPYVIFSESMQAPVADLHVVKASRLADGAGLHLSSFLEWAGASAALNPPNSRHSPSSNQTSRGTAKRSNTATACALRTRLFGRTSRHDWMILPCSSTNATSMAYPMPNV